MKKLNVILTLRWCCLIALYLRLHLCRCLPMLIYLCRTIVGCPHDVIALIRQRGREKRTTKNYKIDSDTRNNWILTEKLEETFARVCFCEDSIESMLFAFERTGHTSWHVAYKINVDFQLAHDVKTEYIMLATVSHVIRRKFTFNEIPSRFLWSHIEIK